MSLMDDLLTTLRIGLQAFGMDQSAAHTVASFSGDDFIRFGDIDISHEGNDFKIVLRNPDDYETPETVIGIINEEFPLTVVSMVLEHRRGYHLRHTITHVSHDD